MGWARSQDARPGGGLKLELLDLGGGAGLGSAGRTDQPGGLRGSDPEPGYEQEGERTQHFSLAEGEDELWRILVPSARDARSAEKPLAGAGALEDEVLCSLDFWPHIEGAISAWSPPGTLPR